MPRYLLDDMARFGNLALRSQLRELGHSKLSLRRGVELGIVRPLRRSWLVAEGAEAPAVRAVALGGRLAATSALASYGVWVSRPSGLWVANSQTSSRLPATSQGEHRLWVNEHFPHGDEKKWRMSVPDALLHYLNLGDEYDVIASLDSALRKGLLTHRKLDAVFEVAPRRVRRLRKRVNRKADSGLETIIRLACEAAGWRVDVQVYVIGVGRVDLLIDGWLVIELDGSQWHDNDHSRDDDGRRDAELTLLGFRYHRFRYRQVMRELPLCLAVIGTILASGRPAVN